MKKTWGRIPGLSTGCGVFLILEDDMLVVRARFSEKNGTASDDRSLSRREAQSVRQMTGRALGRPEDGWDVTIRVGHAYLKRFDPGTDASRPGGPGIVRYEIKQLRFLLGPGSCRKFHAFLGEAIDLWTVSGVMES